MQEAAKEGGSQQNISWNEIKVVQNLIERCLQQYMTQVGDAPSFEHLPRNHQLSTVPFYVD
jgi:hypothetical protein